MNHRQLLRFARIMWAGPLAAAVFVLSGFLFLGAKVFVIAGLGLLVAGGLCLTAGIIAVIMILTTRNSVPETPRRYYKKPAFAVLGLLLLNLPVALAFTLIGGSRLEPGAVESARSPRGDQIAEVLYLDEQDEPAYGLAVTLRAPPGLWSDSPRTVVFSAYCLGTPGLDWQADRKLVITCVGPQQVTRQLTHFRDITIGYRLPVTEPRSRRRARL